MFKKYQDVNKLHSNKEQSFKRLKRILNAQPNGKATAELEASKDPMKYIKDNKNPSWKKLKGVAF